MKKTAIKLTLSAAVAAIAALLLAGCQEESRRQPSAPKEAEIKIPAPIDTAAMDEEHRFQIRLIKSPHYSLYFIGNHNKITLSLPRCSL